jgi:glutathione-regulated potassium-efflux system protein KefB
MPEAVHGGSYLVPVLIFLAAAVAAVPLFRLVGMGAVVGYLLAGVAIGPAGFGFIGDPGTASSISELGVVLLLFIIGLELKPSRLLAMRKDIAWLGLSQMAVCSLAIGLGAYFLLGMTPRGAGVAAVALAFSATAIALQLLDERGSLQSAYGRRAFAMLLFQDIMVAPVLAAIPVLAGGAAPVTGNVRADLISFAPSVAALAVVILAGRYLLNPLFRILINAGAHEVMTAAALLIVLGSAVLMQWAGMSMALGAFLAGVLLSESHFRHELEADIEPFRGLLMGLFFMSVGMEINGPLVLSNVGLLVGLAVGVIVTKTVLIFCLMRASGSSSAEALAGASVLTPAGEFAFVVFPIAAAQGLMSGMHASLLSAVAALTMITGPLVAGPLRRVARKLRRVDENLPDEQIPDGVTGSVLVIGFGRFGQIAVQVLLAERVDVTVIDNDVEQIRAAARFGFKIYYGDGTRLDVLRAAGAGDAQVIAICVDKKETATAIVEIARGQFPLAKINVRAYDRRHALELLEKGADYQIRETFESALAFGGATLEALNEDRDLALSVVDEVRNRDIERLEIQQAGGAYEPAAQSIKPRVQPEPLTRPTTRSRGLNRAAEEIVDETAATGGEEAPRVSEDAPRVGEDAR